MGGDRELGMERKPQVVQRLECSIRVGHNGSCHKDVNGAETMKHFDAMLRG